MGTESNWLARRDHSWHRRRDQIIGLAPAPTGPRKPGLCPERHRWSAPTARPTPAQGKALVRRPKSASSPEGATQTVGHVAAFSEPVSAVAIKGCFLGRPLVCPFRAPLLFVLGRTQGVAQGVAEGERQEQRHRHGRAHRRWVKPKPLICNSFLMNELGKI